MPKFTRPHPYHFELDGTGYLYPPDSVMRVLNAAPYTRDSLEWFPPRQQQAAISELIFPPGAETGQSITDRSGGFGHSDTSHIGGSDRDRPENVYAYTDAVDPGVSGDGQGVDASVEGVAFLGPRVNQVTLPDGLGDLKADWELTLSSTRYHYILMGTKFHRSSDGDTWSAVQANGSDFSGVQVGRATVFQGTQATPIVYLCRTVAGFAQPFSAWNGDTSSSLAAPALTDNNKWIDCAVVDDRMFALWYDSVTQKYRVSSFEDGVASASSGTSPTYSPSIAISDASDPAQFLMVAHNTLYIGCKRSLKTLNDERTSLQETLWYTTAPSTNNFRWWTQWGDELWFTADQSEYRILANGTFEPIGPETITTNRTPLLGVVRAKVGDDYCLYQFLRTNDGVTHLVKFRYYDERRRHSHHPISRIGTYDVNHCFVSTISGDNPRLYFGTGNSTEVRYIVLPRNGVYPPGDDNCEFCERGYIYDTRIHGQLYFVQKSLQAHTSRAENLSATSVITPYYRTDVADDFLPFGAEPLDDDPGQRLDLVEPALCAWWEGRIKLERGGTTTETPKLLASTWSFNYRPIAKAQYTLYAWAVDEPRLRSGGRDNRSAGDVVETLEALDSSQEPKVFRNTWGQAKRVYVNEVRTIDFVLEADEPSQGVVKITLIEFADQPDGTWDDLESLTWDQAESYTWDQIESLIP